MLYSQGCGSLSVQLYTTLDLLMWYEFNFNIRVKIYEQVVKPPANAFTIILPFLLFDEQSEIIILPL